MPGAVLVVEDDRQLREPVRRYLERAGHAVHTTGSGAEALGLLASGLVNRVRGYEFAGYQRTIDSHVKNLRRKLGPDGARIVATVLAVGYRLGWPRDH